MSWTMLRWTIVESSRKLWDLNTCRKFFGRYRSNFPSTPCSKRKLFEQNCLSIEYCQEESKRRLFLSCVMKKGREKGEKKKKVEKAQKIDLNEVIQVLDIDKYTSQMDHSIEDLKNNFIKHLSLRSSVGSIGQVSVEFEGEEYMLQDLAQIVQKPKMVVLNLTTFPQAIPQVLDALSKSGMNLNPQQDGTTLFVPIPKVTKEHREGLAKNAKAIFIKCRDAIKDIRNKELKNLKKKPSISEDQSRRIQSQLEAICDKYIKQAECILDAKQKELLKVSD